MKHPGLTLVELMIASTLAGIVFTLAFGIVNHLSLQQSKIQIAQRFYREGRIAADRITRPLQTYMIDYDRFWGESVSQTCLDQLKIYDNFFGADNEQIVYKDSFYRDLNTTTPNILDTQDGGLDDFNNPDPCHQAIQGPQDHLYLINKKRTQRLSIRHNAAEASLELQRELSIDTNGDGYGDYWSYESTFDPNDNLCKITDPDGVLQVIKGEVNSESFCRRAHPYTRITPDFVEVEALNFIVSPDKDPYLAYEVPASQIQPHVVVKLNMTLQDAESRGFNLNQTPRLNLQTTKSMRVYRDTRPPHNIYRVMCDESGSIGNGPIQPVCLSEETL